MVECMTTDPKPVSGDATRGPKSATPRVVSIMLIVILLFLLVAVTICGIPLLPRGRVEVARRKATIAEISYISLGVEAFKTDVGRYPTTAEGLEALVKCPVGVTGWRHPYLDAVPTDKWGRGYRYEFPSPTDPVDFQITSCGSDGDFNSADDINRATIN
jgi:general secretion pathway protein G